MADSDASAADSDASAAAPETKKEEIEMVMILHHETDMIKGRSHVSFLRVPKNWVDEDGMEQGEITSHGARCWGSNMDKSTVLRRLGACTLKAERLTDKDREELRRVLPDFPEDYPNGKYEWMAPAELSMRNEE